MKRIYLLALLFFAFALTGGCQTQVADSSQTTKVVTENVDGFWSVMGYLGSKLTSELGERLNLVEREEKSELVQVKLRVGGMEFTRKEHRSK